MWPFQQFSYELPGANSLLAEKRKQRKLKNPQILNIEKRHKIIEKLRNIERKVDLFLEKNFSSKKSVNNNENFVNNLEIMKSFSSEIVSSNQTMNSECEKEQKYDFFGNFKENDSKNMDNFSLSSTTDFVEKENKMKKIGKKKQVIFF